MREKQCFSCGSILTQVPKLRCGCFICPDCYVKRKQEDKNAKCEFCFKKLIRK